MVGDRERTRGVVLRAAFAAGVVGALVTFAVLPAASFAAACPEDVPAITVSGEIGDGSQINAFRGTMPLTITVDTGGAMVGGTIAIDWRDGDVETIVPMETCTEPDGSTATLVPRQRISHTYTTAPDPANAYSRQTVDGTPGYLFRPTLNVCYQADECQDGPDYANGYFFMPDSAYSSPPSGTPSGGGGSGGGGSGGGSSGTPAGGDTHNFCLDAANFRLQKDLANLQTAIWSKQAARDEIEADRALGEAQLDALGAVRAAADPLELTTAVQALLTGHVDPKTLAEHAPELMKEVLHSKAGMSFALDWEGPSPIGVHNLQTALEQRQGWLAAFWGRTEQITKAGTAVIKLFDASWTFVGFGVYLSYMDSARGHRALANSWQTNADKYAALEGQALKAAGPSCDVSLNAQRSAARVSRVFTSMRLSLPHVHASAGGGDALPQQAGNEAFAEAAAWAAMSTKAGRFTKQLKAGNAAAATTSLAGLKVSASKLVALVSRRDALRRAAAGELPADSVTLNVVDAKAANETLAALGLPELVLKAAAANHVPLGPLLSALRQPVHAGKLTITNEREAIDPAGLDTTDRTLIKALKKVDGMSVPPATP